MLIEVANLSTEADRRRAALLADAEAFRLARTARAARRGRARVDPSPVDPPRPPQVADPAPERARHDDDDAERRCAVPR